MAAFEYTSGNPANLTGGQAASMADIQGSFTDLRTFLNARIAAIPTLVSALPVSPVDGQEIHYLADATNGVVWHLRYRSASGSAYKWEFVGGRPLYAEVVTSESITGAGYGDLATVGPTVTVPLAGDYDIAHGAMITPPAATTWVSAGQGLSYAGVGAVDAVLISDTSVQFERVNASVSREKRKTALAATNTVRTKYTSGTAAAAASFSDRWLRATPVRVG